jgi:hypothetical protein
LVGSVVFGGVHYFLVVFISFWWGSLVCGGVH